jgi:hypothetical protein
LRGERSVRRVLVLRPDDVDIGQHGDEPPGWKICFVPQTEPPPAVSMPPGPPPAPLPQSMPPSHVFDFGTDSTPGWSNGGGDPPFAFTRSSGSTPTFNTGPSSGPGDCYHAEASLPRVSGDVFALAYDGSVCASLGGVSTVIFQYHMHTHMHMHM